MILVTHELGITGAFLPTDLRQLITVGANNLDVYAIRPHLYKHLAPAGSLYLQVQDVNGNKIKDSETIAISAISAANYWHGYVRFLLTASLKALTQYYICLKSSGYTYASGAHVAWCNGYDGMGHGSTDFTTPSPVGISAPLDFELATYQVSTNKELYR